MLETVIITGNVLVTVLVAVIELLIVNNMKRLIVLLSFALSAPFAFAWSGYNYSTGSFFDVESYDHQYRGEGPVEYFDYRDAP